MIQQRKILIITCHDVYNVGASLQAYALQRYLAGLGFDVKIIDYKPDYLSRHYALNSISNPKYNGFPIKYFYLLAKLPKRVIRLYSRDKKSFDTFKEKYLVLTRRRYISNEDLKKNLPEADFYIAGSDQIWNPLFLNGRDPSFFLDFVPEHKKKISYASSFAVNALPKDIQQKDRVYLKRFNAISVREKSGVAIVKNLGLHAVQVCDPVFLLSSDYWRNMCGEKIIKGQYIFYYDFDHNQQKVNRVIDYAKRNNLQVFSAFKTNGTKKVRILGPKEFVNYVNYATLVVSNSFHATAFSIILHTNFFVFKREEKINSRIKDLLSDMGLENRVFSDEIVSQEIDWKSVDRKIIKERIFSKNFLTNSLQ